jgi:hypothetical protein
MTLEDFLASRYQVASRLPDLSPTHQRHALRAIGSKVDSYVLSLCNDPGKTNAKALEQQHKMLEAMMHPQVILLCRVIEAKLEPDFQAAISESPGSIHLQELVQQQALSMEEVEAFLRMLTEACETAVAAGWPRLSLEASQLYLDPRLGLPRIQTPDLPMVSEDSEALLKNSQDYVLPLATLCGDLLGHPQTGGSGNARFQPLPQLSSQQNVLLRRALSNERRTHYASAKDFIDAFFGVSLHEGYSHHSETLRNLTMTLANASQTESYSDKPIASGAIQVRVGRVQKISPPKVVIAPLVLNETDLALARQLPPAQRLRFAPAKEDSPLLSLVAGSTLALGRSASDADFVAQFRPRSNFNDARSRRISRVQCVAEFRNDIVVLQEDNSVNPSVFGEAPLPSQTELPLPSQLLLAGEYPLEFKPLPSDYPGPREVKDFPPELDSAPHQGAVLIRATTSGVLLCEVALLHSDIGLYFSNSGRPWFRAEPAPIDARIHYLLGQFWIEPIETSMLSLSSKSPSALKAHELRLLAPGQQLKLGTHHYQLTHHEVKLAAQASGTS